MNKYEYWYNVWKELKEEGKTDLSYGEFLDTMESM